jgi:hypothetical protein
MRRKAYRPRSEVELAKPVKAWLESLGYEVFQEVEVPAVGRADIIAVQGPKVFVVECKQQLSWELLCQAQRWQKFAHLVAAAAPRTWSDERNLAKRVFEFLGIGMLSVTYSGVSMADGVEPLPNHNPLCEEITSRLRPEHKTYAEAGTSRGGHFTEFKGTVAALESFVREHPGVALKDAATHVPNHYASRASFMAAVRHWSGKVIKGIEIREVHGVDCLFPIQQEEAAS